MNKKIFSLIIIIWSSAITICIAADYVPLEPLPYYGYSLVPEEGVGLSTYLESVFAFGISIAGIMAVAMIVIGGIQYITAYGNTGMVEKAKDRITQAQKQTKENDALVVMKGQLKGRDIVAAAFDFGFMGGSMGSVVGERFVRGVKTCINQHLPFICFSASGGARMQEGLFSLMQMAKTTAALTRLSHNKLPFISVLTDPTMGGVSASFAFIGDVVIAEPGALIGFAGPRVIEQTVRQTLPEGFQRAEFLLQHGAIDMIVDRRQMRDKLVNLCTQLMRVPAPIS